MKIALIAAFGLSLAAGLAPGFAPAPARANDAPTVPEAVARAEVMKTIGAQVKVLGDMAGGRTDFDAGAATQAQTALVEAAASLGTVFETEGAADPASESAAVIWTDWEGFMAEADKLLAAAEGLDPASLDGVKAGMSAVGGTCRACHSVYRE
ncbi:c-type cytochrome [Pseudogemmobacter sonorensis]|uniref:c-type cytochrome n=1 Tax=Pseudogemmobacter sonorensis TaxID=2989681 RepID=UPI0036C8F54D